MNAGEIVIHEVEGHSRLVVLDLFENVLVKRMNRSMDVRMVARSDRRWPGTGRAARLFSMALMIRVFWFDSPAGTEHHPVHERGDHGGNAVD